MDVVLIRHPAVGIEPGICYGRSDVPLATPADAGATAVRTHLSAIGAPLPEQVWTSPLMRCA